METCRDFFRRRQLLTFYLLAFAISWTALLLVALPAGFPGRPGELERLLPLGIAAMLLGPTGAGLLSTWLAGGTPGLRALLQRLTDWRAAPRWYAVALLTAPLSMLLVLALLSLTSPDYRPGILIEGGRARLILLALLAGPAAGIFEELGWTGVALPLLRRRYSVLQTGLLMGFLWGAWHYIVNFWGSGNAAGGYDPRLLVPSLLWSLLLLPAYRVLMVWQYDRARSLPLAMLMHAVLTSGMLLFNPADTAVHIPYSLAVTAVFALLGWLVLRRLPAARRSPAPLPGRVWERRRLDGLS